jgi:hypothetical protein
MAPGTFPQSTDGDVKIAVLPDIYQLQSSVLGRNSQILRRLIESDQSFVASPRQSNASSRCVNMNLVGSSAHKYGMLEIQVSNCA